MKMNARATLVLMEGSALIVLIVTNVSAKKDTLEKTVKLVSNPCPNKCHNF